MKLHFAIGGRGPAVRLVLGRLTTSLRFGPLKQQSKIQVLASFRPVWLLRERVTDIVRAFVCIAIDNYDRQHAPMRS